MLDAVLGQEDKFMSSKEEEGLYVWPHPLDCSGTNVLLMEMNGDLLIRKTDSAEKLAVIAMALSAVCGVCLERTSLFTNLNHVLDLGDTAGTLLSLPSQYLVFAQRQEMSKAKWNSEREKNAQKYGERQVHFLEREYDSLSPELISSIKRHLSGCSKDYQSIIAPHDQQDIKFSYFIRLCQKIASATTNQTDFRRQFANLKENEFNPYHIEEIRKQREVVMAASSLKLLECTWNSISVREEALNTLLTNFGKERETVVLVVLGDQGIGKSTLLNRIVQYATSLPFRQIFQSGNTTTHTTRESEVLSCPLWVGARRDKQCLLIDLEGLEGTETVISTNATLQERMVTGILALASVPCIVISNTLVSMNSLRQRVQLISELKQYYKYDVERIILLFHDKNSEAEANSDWERTLQELQSKFFEGRRVFLVLNKPNFAENDPEQQEIFLSRLLAECEFTRSKQGQPVDLAAIIHEVCEIAHSLESVETLILTREEEREYQDQAHSCLEEIDKIYQLPTEREEELVLVFDGFLQEMKGNIENQKCSVAVKRMLLKELDRRSQQLHLFALEQEAFHLQTKFLIDEEIPQGLRSFLNQAKHFHLSKFAWIDKKLIEEKFRLLISKLERQMKHFPSDSELYFTLKDQTQKMSNKIGSKIQLVTGLRNILESHLGELRASPFIKPPVKSPSIILVVGGPERIHFCNRLVEIFKPLTFPGFQTFTEGNQYFDFTFGLPSYGLGRYRIISIGLSDNYEEFATPAELLSRSSIAYILLGTKTSILPPLEATEMLLKLYSSLRREDSYKAVTFLCIEKGNISKCHDIAMRLFQAEYKQTSFCDSDASLLEVLYKAPKLLNRT